MMHFWSSLTVGQAACALALAYAPLLHAAADCDEKPVSARSETAPANTGRQYLGQGIALFDAKDFQTAERAFQSALFAGLPDVQERASAHKYLAFIYCTNGEGKRCESEFDAAFAARPSFKIDGYELNNTPWRSAYFRSQARWATRCGKPVLDASSDSMATPGAGRPADAVTAVASPASRAPVAQASNSVPVSTLFKAVDKESAFNVRIRLAPWGNVQVDGKPLGVSPPLTQLKLPAGSHSLELSNPGFETVKKVITVIDGETFTIEHDFDAR
ncbi:PEGA domain-containing protein [Acidovorax sp. NCPPB 3576]|uniref:PEGA domain-containing protein n=1 Tax=Acidovorax sp. NCPPB 3576 TaxID=2940488 RepID=UPI00234AFC52|nr:PEGA domain-containing protein [Acidovorax sp. NCPPB 3576]WCM90123.1 PEGA domain-containing protein [Acidovorax sp. NCPPB 3576]